jgi:hypothetical protein
MERVKTENVSNLLSFPPPTLCSGTTLVEQDLTSTRSDLQAHYHPFHFLTEFARQLALMGSATPNAPSVKSLSGTIFLILVLTKIGRKKKDDQTHNSHMTHCHMQTLINLSSVSKVKTNILSFCGFTTMENL